MTSGQINCMKNPSVKFLTHLLPHLELFTQRTFKNFTLTKKSQYRRKLSVKFFIVRIKHRLTLLVYNNCIATTTARISC